MNSISPQPARLAAGSKLITRATAHGTITVSNIETLVTCDFEVLSISLNGHRLEWTPVLRIIPNPLSETIAVSTKRKRGVTLARDSFISVVNDQGQLLRVPAIAAGGKILPFARELPPIIEPSSNDPSIGWLIGAFVSDGWISRTGTLGFTKFNDLIRKRFIKAWASWCGAESPVFEYSENHDAETNAISGQSKKIHIPLRTPAENARATWLWEQCFHRDVDSAPSSMRTCLFKRLPDGFLNYSREMRLAILAGLIDGDGSISLNKSKGKPQVLASFSTSSPYLSEDVQTLLTSLGIKSSVSETKPMAGRLQKHTSFTISMSTPDLHPMMDEIQIVTAYDGWKYLRENPPDIDRRDIVPFWDDVARHILSEIFWEEEFGKRKASLTTTISQVRTNCGAISRASAQWYLGLLNDADDPPGLQYFRALVANRSISCDYIDEVSSGIPRESFTVVTAESKLLALANGALM